MHICTKNNQKGETRQSFVHESKMNSNVHVIHAFIFIDRYVFGDLASFKLCLWI